MLRICSHEGIAVVPQGGNTGLVGGAVPFDGAVVLSLTRLDRIDPVVRSDRQIIAGAGVTLESLQRAAGERGLRFTVDLAARSSATLGGMTATNAGGMHVLRFGMMRDHVVGTEAVLSDGSVLTNLNGLAKDNTGYHFDGLFCGSEGTLAVITAVRLRLRSVPESIAVAMLGFDSLANLQRGFEVLHRCLPGLEAAEYVEQRGLDLVCQTFGLSPPFPVRCSHCLMVEVVAGSEAVAVEVLAAGVAEMESEVPLAASAVAGDAAGRARLWAFRERHTDAIARLGPVHKLDVTLPADRLVDFATNMPVMVNRLNGAASVWLFGHIGDGNIHVNITGIAPDDDLVDDVVLRSVIDAGGSISAEHGIGRAKRRWLPIMRSAADLRAYAAVKRALDPSGILNPGVILDDR